MLVQCLRRWPTINPALMEYFLFDMHTWMFWKPTRQYNTKARWCYRWFSLWPSTVAHGPVRLLWCLIQDKHHTGLKCVCNLVTWYTLLDNADQVLRFWGVLFSISSVAIPLNCYHSYSPTHQFMLFKQLTVKYHLSCTVFSFFIGVCIKASAWSTMHLVRWPVI